MLRWSCNVVMAYCDVSGLVALLLIKMIMISRNQSRQRRFHDWNFSPVGKTWQYFICDLRPPGQWQVVRGAKHF